jgi:hypothetical protein
MKMTPRQVESWSRTRAKGRTRFVWLTGVVSWGLLVAIFWSVAMASFQGWDRFPRRLGIALILFPIGGYWFGSYVWRKSEEQYEETLRAQTRTGTDT